MELPIYNFNKYYFNPWQETSLRLTGFQTEIHPIKLIQ